MPQADKDRNTNQYLTEGRATSPYLKVGVSARAFDDRVSKADRGHRNPAGVSAHPHCEARGRRKMKIDLNEKEVEFLTRMLERAELFMMRNTPADMRQVDLPKLKNLKHKFETMKKFKING